MKSKTEADAADGKKTRVGMRSDGEKRAKARKTSCRGRGTYEGPGNWCRISLRKETAAFMDEFCEKYGLTWNDVVSSFAKNCRISKNANGDLVIEVVRPFTIDPHGRKKYMNGKAGAAAETP